MSIFAKYLKINAINAIHKKITIFQKWNFVHKNDRFDSFLVTKHDLKNIHVAGLYEKSFFGILLYVY